MIDIKENETFTHENYPHTFQIKIFTLLLFDKVYLEQIQEILLEGFFDTDASKWMLTTIKSYYNEYKVAPTFDVLYKKINEIQNDVLKISVKDLLQKTEKNKMASDLEFVKKESLDFCMNQTLQNAIFDSIDDLKLKKWSNVRSRIDIALKSGGDRNVGHMYKDRLEDRMNDAARNCVPSPWDAINDLTNGGASAGDLFIVVSPPGIGKCVGPKTKIEIEYEEIGIIVKKTISMKELFNIFHVDEIENACVRPHVNINVKTPYGFYKIDALFRTEKQLPVMLYFSNGKTLKVSNKHRLKCNGEWKAVEDINIGDFVENDGGMVQLKRKTIKTIPEILYDINVKDVHCYYSNGILSHNSWLLVNVGVHAIKRGLTVIHYTMELGENYVGRRYDSNITGVASQNLKYHMEDIQAAVSKIDGKLIIKYYPPKAATPNTLRAHIDRCSIQGHRPDLIIVDYADLLRSTTMTNKMEIRHVLENIYEDLRALAGEYGIPVWSASQSNRCLSPNTIINKPNENILLKNAKVGDLVKTCVGYKKITNIFVESQLGYKITLKSGKSIICSINHEFPIKYGKLLSIQTGLCIGHKLFIKKS